MFTYDYDNLNRLRTIVPNTTNAPGVAPGGGAGFTYNNNNGSPTNGLLLSAGNETYSYDSYRRLASVTRDIDGINYTTSYQYGAGSLRSQITYPSGRVLNINRSSTGRLNSLTEQYGPNYASSISYNAAGQVTGLTLGNGVAETYGYDANRLQLTSQTATKSGGLQNGLMNLTYSYQATAGQMGAGTTAGNAGQLMGISGTINSTTESAAYTYDDLGRLVTSNQTSNGSSAQRRFAYDRWGNRTGVWDAVSGGNQIQSVVLQQSGGAPTNQLQSVTTSGVTKNYSYDAAGNVTNDGVHTYQYDAANRIVTVDAGATAQYFYDQNNRRIKKVAGMNVTCYVWEGSQVVSEHDGTGTVVADYIYSGSRMIAQSASGVMQYYLSDKLSTRLVLDSSANVTGRMAHLPFGEDFGESGTQEKHHFTSYERDAESGLDYAVNRGRSPILGRFQQADPYRASGSLVDPQSWNRYAYARNEPINRVDALGLQDGPLGIDDLIAYLKFLAAGGLKDSISVNIGLGGGRGSNSGAGSGADQFDTEEGSGSGSIAGEDPGPQSEIDPYKPDGDDDCVDFVLYLQKLMRKFKEKTAGIERLAIALGLSATSYAKTDSTTGFVGTLYGRDEKPKDQQGGEMYKHILAFAALELKLNLNGGLAERTAIKTALDYDAAQQATGRRESNAEVADDYAGIKVGDLLYKGLTGDPSDAAIEMVKELCEL